MLDDHRVIPSIKFTGSHLYTCVEKGTVRVKCLAQENNAMSRVSAETRTTNNSRYTVPTKLQNKKGIKQITIYF